MNRRLVSSALLVAGLTAACGDSEFQPAWEEGSPPPNILFLSIDTLRTDHLGYDGYEKPTSPNIDAWAETAMIFDSAQASASWTLPGLATALTGTYCSTHRCWGFGDRLDNSFPTVTELLLGAGYDTACVTSHIFLATRYGLQQGFVHFDDSFAHPEVDPKDSVTSEMVSDKGIEFLEQKAAVADDAPWLLWLHYFDPHDTYVEHEGFSEPFLTDTTDHTTRELELYDGEIRFTDFHVGRVLDKLRETGLAEDTIIVFFSDHGEEFKDHDGVRHGHHLWRELCRVPFVIGGPGITAGRHAGTVRTVDLLPTVLDLAGLADRIPEGIPGMSLAPVLTGDSAAHATSTSLAEIQLSPQNKYKSYVDGPWKLIWHFAPGDVRQDDVIQLFNLETDPLETTDLATTETEIAESMKARLTKAFGDALSFGNSFEHSVGVDLSGADRKMLSDLGYLGDGQQARGAGGEEGQ